MAKIGLTKLGLTKVNQEIKEIEFNGQKIEVKEYLPINDKLELMSTVINLSMAGNVFANPVQIEVYTVLQIFEYYTNINFTEKQKEDICKLYDLLIGSGLKNIIFENIDSKEIEYIINGIKDSIEALYKYQNSVVGVLESISANYSNVNFDLEQIMDKVKDPESLALIKQLLPLLGRTPVETV